VPITIRTVFQPSVPLTVSDAEYIGLLKRGLVYVVDTGQQIDIPTSGAIVTVNIRTTMDPSRIITVSDTEFLDLVRQRLVYSVESGGPIAYPNFTAGQYVELDSRYGGTVLRSQEVIVIGDSIDAGGDDDQSARPYWSGSVWSYTALYARGRFRLVRNEGIGGQSTTQMLARFETSVVNRKPGIVIIGGGRNDLNGGIATNVTRSNIEAMVKRAKAAGIHPVLHTMPPVDIAGSGDFGTTDLNRAGTVAHNAWLATLAASYGIELIDIWRLWADPTTKGYQAGFTADGVHPTLDSIRAAARSLSLGLLPPVFAAPSTLPVGNADPTNLWSNTLLLAAGGGTKPDGWTTTATTALQGTATGNRFSLTVPGTGPVVAYGPSTPAGSFATGDVLAFSGEVSSSGNGTTVTIQALNQDYQLIASPAAGFGGVIEDGVFYQEYKVEATVSAAILYFGGQGSAGTVSLRRPVIRNLTRLGVR
jgi:lysophospholipase L1-like esterase